LAAPGASLACRRAAPTLHDALASAGFEVEGGTGLRDEHAITRARFAPRFTPRRAPARVRGRATIDPQVLIVGAGLAGCAAAWALAEQGWRSSVFDRHAQIGAEASGNPAGLFHGTVNAHDGVHARIHRAAALAAHDAVQIALERHGAAGSAQGLLRLETTLGLEQMRAILAHQGLPPDYVQALGADRSSAHAGIPLADPAWFYPGGGWVDPAGLARSFLERAKSSAVLQPHAADVQALRRSTSGWSLLDTQGRVIAEAPTVVLANAADALRLLGAPAWPVELIRGQISTLEAPSAKLALPRLPIAGAGYLLPSVDGRAVFGATAQAGDLDASVRLADHATNLAQLERLVGHRLDVDAADLQGRTAWRCSARDRLPVIGPVPDLTQALQAARLDQPRFVPRLPGLFVFTALGSRGITWSALGAQLLASFVTGAPAPLEASLLDAVDPARFISRQARRAAG
ncbi:MAG: FAD-dependent 5-carboxymethylaminomethyl-2-thiouridine(34) oxidoreductase MnmC, partial [Burkholderiaceae bacterium]